jgi:hypothetical protein
MNIAVADDPIQTSDRSSKFAGTRMISEGKPHL